jgi:hypothetical protein
MACFAAYTELCWGELAALTIAQIDLAARVVTVDRKVIKISGQLYLEAPKGRKQPRTIYPRQTPQGYPWPTWSPSASSRPAPASCAQRPAGARGPGAACLARSGHRMAWFLPQLRANPLGSELAPHRGYLHGAARRRHAGA